MSQLNNVNWWHITQFLMILFFTALIGLFVHELGHGITTELLGGEFTGLYVFPGIEIYPDFGAEYPFRWGQVFGLVTSNPADHWTDWHRGLIALMGAGSTLIISPLALGVLWWKHPQNRIVRYTLICFALFFADIFTYSIMPTLGLRHWVIYGGRYAEPVRGAEMMGISPLVFVPLVVSISGMLTYGLYRYLRLPE